MSGNIAQPLTLPLLPYLDEEGLTCFQERIKSSRIYLEYGCGGSSYYAATIAQLPVIIAVDSDKNWVNLVRRELASSFTNLLVEHCDIGEVGQWGCPVNETGIKNYWRYSTIPWEIAKRYSLVPDLILIDGRFRIASFLYSLLCAKEGTTILFDDYFDRPAYSVVEQYCPPIGRAGRMGIFTVTKTFSYAELCARYAEYSLQPG